MPMRRCDIRDYFVERLDACAAAGIAGGAIAVDPGIGFGKNDRHNIELVRDLGVFHELGVPVLLGVSRKSFIGRLSRKEPAKQRLAGSLAAGARRARPAASQMPAGPRRGRDAPGAGASGRPSRFGVTPPAAYASAP